MASLSLTNLAASGIALFQQDARLLTLRFAESSGLGDDTLLPHRLRGEEALSQSYCYSLDCLSADMHLELKDLIGQPVEIGLLLPDGGMRLLTGLVTRAEQRGADGGFATYTLTIEPALATLAHRRNSRVFQDLSIPAIVATLLDEHLTANPAFTHSFAYQDRLEQTYPERSYTLQYRESDLAFIERLLAEEGISYHYSHGPDPDTSLQDNLASQTDATPLHTLILFDSNAALDPHARGEIRFHRTDGVEGEDSIDIWHGSRQLSSQSTTLASYDYRAVATHRASDDSRTRHGDSGEALHSNLEDYDPQTGYYGTNPDEMARYTALRQQAKDLAQKTFNGEGSRRDLTPGSHFAITDHPIHDQDNPEDRQFLVTRHRFEAENNLTQDAQSQLAGLLGNDEAGQNRPPYRNRFDAIRKNIAVVPAYSASRHQKPTAHGLTTATVVGPADEEIFTDPHGRIKIQFHWQRPSDHPTGGADFDDHSSTWVRVAMPSAGATWGSLYIPRIGQEVVIDFIEGDIDRPLITGVVYNGSHRPPTFSGAGSLPANKTLSGHKSKEYKGGRYNELLFDDSTDEIRTKLSSEHGKTQLNQGYLVHPRTEGKGEARGEGFELRTDESGALRAAKGVLISAEARGQAVGHQLDRDMFIGQMQAAEAISKSLSDLSADHGAEITETEPQSQLLKHLENWEHGSNTAPKENIADGGKPIVAISGPLGIAAATPESITMTAGNNLDLVSVKHANLSIGGKWLARVSDSFSLFVHRLGMKLIAAGGHIDIEAQNGEIRISASKKITLTSCDEIVIQAPKVTAIAQGAQIDMGGGAITTQCSATHEQKAAMHKLTGPGGGTPKGAFQPKNARFDQKIALTWMGTGDPIKNRRYRITLEDGRILEGLTDAEGNAEQVQSEIGFARYRLELLPE